MFLSPLLNHYFSFDLGVLCARLAHVIYYAGVNFGREMSLLISS